MSTGEVLAALGVAGLVLLGLTGVAQAATDVPPPAEPLPLPPEPGAGPDKKKRFSRLVYPPRTPETYALFEAAAEVAQVPTSWARSDGLQNLLEHESDGRVGRPNYAYGKRVRDPLEWPKIWAELQRGVISAASSATGLGQLILSNVKTLYPDGVAGIGDAFNEAVGMLRYIQHTYKTPEKAWAFWKEPKINLKTGRPKKPQGTWY